MNKKLIRRGMEYYVEMEALAGEDYEYQMLMANSVDGLLSVRTEQINQKKMVLYNVTGYHSWEDDLDKMWIKESQLREIVESILNAIMNIKRYLLYPDNLVLQKESIYIERREPVYSDANSMRLYFLYVPGYQKDILKQLRAFLEEVLERVDPKEVEAVMLAWRLRMILKEPQLNFKAIQECVERGESNQMRMERGNDQSTNWEKERGYSQNTNWNAKKEYSQSTNQMEEKSHGRENNRINTILLTINSVLVVIFLALEGGILFHIYYYGILEWKRNALVCNSVALVIAIFSWLTLWKKRKEEKQLEQLFQRGPIPQEKADYHAENTTLLEPEPAAQYPRLCSLDKKETDIIIYKTPFVVGKDRKNTDYQLNQSVVSRIHARIVKKDGRYYIEDMASTNGTYVNHVRLNPNQLFEMRSGDRICLANVEFCFSPC